MTEEVFAGLFVSWRSVSGLIPVLIALASVVAAILFGTRGGEVIVRLFINRYWRNSSLPPLIPTSLLNNIRMKGYKSLLQRVVDCEWFVRLLPFDYSYIHTYHIYIVVYNLQYLMMY